MDTSTFTVISPCLGHDAGADVSYPADDVAHLVAAGKLVKKSAASRAEADAGLDSLAESLAESAFAMTVSKFNEKARSSGRLNLSVGNHAEAKDHGSLGEWLWAAAGMAQTMDRGKAEHCKGLITNKYPCKINPDFGRQYEAAVSKGAGGSDGSGAAISKALVQVENVGALGGLTVPPQFSNEFFKLAVPKSLFMGRCKRYTMTGKELMIPALDYTKGAAGVSPYLGGMSAAWSAENVGFVQQNASVRQIKLVANLLAGYTQSSRTLLADSAVSLEQVLTDLFAGAIAYNFDQAIFNGSGVDQPKGMIVSGACSTFTRGTWTSNGVLLGDLAKADSLLIPELEGEAIWVVPPSFKQKLYPMTDASGKVVFLANGAPGPEGPAAMRPSMRVFGKDLFYSQLPASQATAGSVNLLIPSLYALGMREEIEIGVSEHFAFTTNLLTWRFLFRGDGQSLLNTTLTLQNTDVVAPFVSIN